MIEEIEKRRKEQNELEKNATIQIRQKDLETEIKILELDQQSEYARLEKQRLVDIKKAQEKAEIIREQSERNRDAEEAQAAIDKQAREDAKTASDTNRASGKAKLKAGETLNDAELSALFGD